MLQREIEALADAGYREVTLLGQNIDAYGRDLPGFAEDGSGRRAHTLTDLLHYIHDVPGIARIRFATSHPRHGPAPLVAFSSSKMSAWLSATDTELSSSIGLQSKAKPAAGSIWSCHVNAENQQWVLRAPTL